jgi:cytochrome c biogenesis protein CcmG/thiol:disulfide interchange protein DsbE
VNWKRALVAALFAVPLLGLFAWGFTRDPDAIPSPLPGREAPKFKLEVFAPGEPPLSRPIGDTVRLADLRGQVVVLNFWASWCLACGHEHSALSETARSYAGRPVQFLGVLYNDTASNGRSWIEQMGGQTYPSVTDPESRTAIDYGLYGVPETFVIDPMGRVAFKHTGAISEAILHRIVDSLMVANASSLPKGGP